MHNMHRYTNSTRVDNKLSVLFFIPTALDFRPNSHTQAHDVENVITRHTRDLIWIGFVDFICFLSCPCGFLRTLFLEATFSGRHKCSISYEFICCKTAQAALLMDS